MGLGHRNQYRVLIRRQNPEGPTARVFSSEAVGTLIERRFRLAMRCFGLWQNKTKPYNIYSMGYENSLEAGYERLSVRKEIERGRSGSS